MSNESGGQPALDQVEYTSTTSAPEAEEVKEAPETEGKEPSRETETPEEKPDTAAESPKKKGGWTRKKEKLQREMQQKDLENQFLKSELAKLSAGTPKPSEAGEPKPEDFESFLDFNSALIDWKAEQKAKTITKAEFEGRDKKAQERQEQTEFRVKVQTYEERLKPILETVPDFPERSDELYAQGLISKPLQNAVLESELGPQIQLHFINNPQELIDLRGASEAQINRAIGRLEAKLENPVAAVRTTKAPPPITPIKPQASTANKKPEEMSQSEYEAWRFSDRR